MKLRFSSLLPIAALLLFSGRLVAADAIELKQQWQTGKKYFNTMTMVQTSTMTLGAQKMDQKVNMTIEMSTAVTRHEDGKQRRLTVKYDRMAMKMDMNGQEMGYDSAKPGEDPTGMGKGFAGIIGKELKVLADENSEITAIENFDEFIAGAAAGPAGLALGQMFTRDSLTDMMKQGSLKALPGKPVKPGDSWPYDFAMKMPQIGNITQKGAYTFKGMTQRGGIACAEIAMDGTLQIDVKAPAAGAADAGAAGMLAALGMKMKGGKLAGTIWFDPALGMARDADYSQEMEMTMNNPAQADATITIPMKQHVTLTLTKVEDVK